MNKIIGGLAFIAACGGAGAQQPPYAGSLPTMDSRPLWQQQLPGWQQQLPTRANPDRSDREPGFGQSQADSARRRQSFDNEQQRRNEQQRLNDEQMRIIRRPLNIE